MATVIRVKRRIDEEPLNAFVLNCKKRKLLQETTPSSNLLENDTEVSQILKFAGTVESHENLTSSISRLTKSEAKETMQKTRDPNIVNRARQQYRRNLHTNRFRVVNCFRSIENDDEVSTVASPNYTVVDIVKQDSSNGELDSKSSTAPQTDPDRISSIEDQQPNVNFVYDLYFPEGDQQVEFDNNVIDNLISVHPFDNLVYQGDDRYADSDSCESEDSNDENNYRNDYPDTDPENYSAGEEEFRQMVEDLDMNSDNELSSDDSEFSGSEPQHIHFAQATGDDEEYRYLKRYGTSRRNLLSRHRSALKKVDEDSNDDENNDDDDDDKIDDKDDEKDDD